MHYISTRDGDEKMSFAAALMKGLAPEGGLYVPSALPILKIEEYTTALSYPEFAAKLLRGFVKDKMLLGQLSQLCANAFNFPVPVSMLDANTSLLELYHGPTLSFKDFGARFLAECMAVLVEDKLPVTVLVATSGDTGSAVAAAFYHKPKINVVVLFPEGQITQRQQQQITCWGDNVLAVAVRGSFDDCQHLVKEAFVGSWWRERTRLSTANSINIGRLLPQMVYYAYSSVHYLAQHKVRTGVIVPSGNLGNATAAYWARQLGFPIREVAIATNANQVVEEYLQTGEFAPRPSVMTLANAMDVGKPSNFERLAHLYPSLQEFKQHVQAFSVNDEQIRFAIKECYQRYHRVICPHTATAYFMRQQLSDEPWMIVGTADPCKFETIIEPLLEIDLPPTPALQKLLDRPAHQKTIDADETALSCLIQTYFP